MKISKREEDKIVEDYFESSSIPTFLKLESFPRFVSLTTLRHFICRYEIFKKILRVNGSIFECGVFNGKGLFTWLKLAAIFEPQNFTRKIIGFDTFEGFPEIDAVDEKVSVKEIPPEIGDYQQVGTLDHIMEGVRILENSFSGTFAQNRVELVKGNVEETIPRFLEENPHIVISLLHLDFDLYRPTKVALKYCLPRMPKGAVVAFDELNAPRFPGETVAVLEEAGLQNLRLERFQFGTYISFAVLD